MTPHDEPTLKEMLKEILLILKDPEVGVCPRVKKLEETINGNGKQGLAEIVRNIGKENDKWTATVATIVSFVVALLFAYVSKKIGL